jgi:hypothetical protein
LLLEINLTAESAEIAEERQEEYSAFSAVEK